MSCCNLKGISLIEAMIVFSSEKCIICRSNHETIRMYNTRRN